MIPSLVVVEVAVNLKKHGWDNLRPIKEVFSNFTVLSLDGKSAYSLLDLWEANSLKASDFVVAATAKLNKAVLVTWDKRLLENKICEVMTPAQWLKNLGEEN